MWLTLYIIKPLHHYGIATIIQVTCPKGTQTQDMNSGITQMLILHGDRTRDTQTVRLACNYSSIKSNLIKIVSFDVKIKLILFKSYPMP